MLSYTDNTSSNPVLVLIHGFCETKNIWKDFQKAITPFFRVICIDLPGCGESNVLNKDQPLLSDFADEIYTTLLQLNINKCTMVGHSLGGYVTLAYANKYPQTLNGIGLFHSTAFADDDAKKDVRVRAAEFVRENGMKAFVAPMIANLFALKHREQFRTEINAIIEEATHESKEETAKISLAMGLREDHSPLFSSLSVPVLFIIGKEDGAVPLSKSIEQAHLPKDAHVYYMADVGHMGMFEVQTKTQQIILNFLTYTNNQTTA
ncbi:alpha/beta fold hydrolase [Flammeovirga kamogawensis]|uniref:Alpha/beta hydrolase n=1 Tax=Flammeovirga kamogawensis TaxID=373891 RepID=A0ABX8GR69_9BACT|nr:alpha/beta hydrolase [Flammeovirga kamogawensis]MBB6462695.1 pimeloyl-ACP methyl ester carboxylesterase [Flammeovirga kamogawensis]QWG06069.1 alpha/beta hydrolase [Flammeovirga kamogawensis]TRX67902.1 alpha/beta hydrolase [Flammeovirga kamogawensis]